MAQPSKVFNLNANGEVKVSLAADTDVASELIETSQTPAPKLPSVPLTSRHVIVVCLPLDTVFLGASGVTHLTGYPARGRQGGNGWTFQSVRSAYSNRKQFLRGQYEVLHLSNELDLYVNSEAFEQAVGFELS